MPPAHCLVASEAIGSVIARRHGGRGPASARGGADGLRLRPVAPESAGPARRQVRNRERQCLSALEAHQTLAGAAAAPCPTSTACAACSCSGPFEFTAPVVLTAETENAFRLLALKELPQQAAPPVPLQPRQPPPPQQPRWVQVGQEWLPAAVWSLLAAVRHQHTSHAQHTCHSSVFALLGAAQAGRTAACAAAAHTAGRSTCPRTTPAAAAAAPAAGRGAGGSAGTRGWWRRGR